MKKKKAIKQRRQHITLIVLSSIILIFFVVFGAIATAHLSVPRSLELRQTRIAEPDAFSLTATALISQLTQDASIVKAIELGILTPEPTATFMSIDALQRIWVEQIEQNLGFTHPVIEKAVSELTSTNQEAFVKREFWLQYNMPHKSEDLPYDAVLVKTANSAYLPNQGRLLIFHHSENSTTVIYDHDVGESYFVWFGHKGIQSYFMQFSDVNNNGLNDLAFAHSNGTQCPQSRLSIFELDGDKLIDISPDDGEFFDGDSHFEFVAIDMNDDDIFEIVYRFPHLYKGDVSNQTAPCKITNENFWYEWNGERYALVDRD